MTKRKRPTTHNLVVIGDTHAGCPVALLPPSGIRLDGGTHVRPSKFQAAIWKLWEYFWDEWVPRATRGEPFDVLHLGDAVDGKPHGSISQITHNLNDQVRIAIEVLKPYVSRGERYYHLRGTEAHVEKSGYAEEIVARELGAAPDANGNHARYALRKLVGNGLVNAMHHIGTTSSAAYESTAVLKELTENYQECAAWNHRPPDVIVRGHRHRYMEVRKPSGLGFICSVVCPGWQGKTPFAWRIAGGRQSDPQFGGLLIRAGDEDPIYVRPWVKSMPPEKPE